MSTKKNHWKMSKLMDFFTRYIFPSNPTVGRLGCIDYNLCLLHWTGMPFFGAQRESKPSILFYGIIVWTLMRIPYQIFEIYDIILIYDNMGDLTQNLCLTLVHFGASLKTIMIFSRLGDFYKIIKQLRIMSIKYIRTKEQISAFFKTEFETKLTLTVYALNVTLTACIGMLMVLIGPANFIGHNFPYRAKMPSFIPMGFQLVYVPLVVAVVGLQSVAIDYLNVTFMNLTRSQLQMLNLSFDELNEEKLGRVTVDPLKHLNSLIEHHTSILNVRDQIESIFKHPMLVQFIGSLMIIALTGFQVLVQSNTSGLVMIYLYVVCILTELFVYCWFGTEVSEQNETLAMRGYDSSWYNFDLKYRKSLVIFLMNAQRPFRFTAGGYIELNLSTFSQILSKSYSIVALLRQQYNG